MILRFWVYCEVGGFGCGEEIVVDVEDWSRRVYRVVLLGLMI